MVLPPKSQAAAHIKGQESFWQREKKANSIETHREISAARSSCRRKGLERTYSHTWEDTGLAQALDPPWLGTLEKATAQQPTKTNPTATPIHRSNRDPGKIQFITA